MIWNFVSNDNYKIMSDPNNSRFANDILDIF